MFAAVVKATHLRLVQQEHVDWLGAVTVSSNRQEGTKEEQTNEPPIERTNSNQPHQASRIRLNTPTKANEGRCNGRQRRSTLQKVSRRADARRERSVQETNGVTASTACFEFQKAGLGACVLACLLARVGMLPCTLVRTLAPVHVLVRLAYSCLVWETHSIVSWLIGVRAVSLLTCTWCVHSLVGGEMCVCVCACVRV